MTQKEKLLGQEIAKLSRRIHQQRIALSEKASVIEIARQVGMITKEATAENLALKQQVTRLQTENRALRIYIAEQKIPSRVRLWLGL